MLAPSCLGKSHYLCWVGPLLLIHAEVSRVPPRVPGVYLLHVLATTDGSYAILYAGKSADLHRRLSDHLDAARAKYLIRAAHRGFRLYFSAAPVISAALRDQVESGLIWALRPVANQQFPTAPPVLVNLPPLTLWR